MKADYTHSKEAEATAEKLCLLLLTAAQELSPSPPPAPRSVVIQLSALRFEVGRC